jgi:hypothetical protein
VARNIVLDQVPGVSGEFVPDLGRQTGRAVPAHVFVTAEIDAKQPVETEKVVHVGV